jgi:glyoxylase I family protein
MKKGENPVIGGGGFHHIAIRVKDFDGMVKFYIEGLGFKEKIRWGEGDKRSIMLDTGDGNYVELFAGGLDQPKPEGNILHVAFRSNHCDAALARAKAAGATVTMEPTDVKIESQPHATPVRIAFCKAPDGTVIEFFQNELT